MGGCSVGCWGYQHRPALVWLFTGSQLLGEQAQGTGAAEADKGKQSSFGRASEKYAPQIRYWCSRKLPQGVNLELTLKNEVPSKEKVVGGCSVGRVERHEAAWCSQFP